MRAKELVIAVATVAFCALTVVLGNWQLGRGAEKLARQAMLEERGRLAPRAIGRDDLEPAEIEWARIRARGEWVPDATIYLDNRVHQGQAGFRVLTPIRLDGTRRHILVDRGWVAAGRTRADLPTVATPGGPVTVDGIAQRFPERLLELGAATPEGRVWQNFDLDRYRRSTDLDVHPIMLLETSEATDGLVRAPIAPASGAEKNHAYALQWYSFGAIAAGIYAYWFLRRRRRVPG